MKYYDVSNWAVVESRVMHFYNQEETPFTAVCVNVGETDNNTAILKWMTENEYNSIRNNAQTIR